VLGSWQWLHAYWLPTEDVDLALIAPGMVLGCLIPGLLGGRDGGWRKRTLPMLALVVPSLVAIGVWFFVIPDPRFVWAPLWLVPIALAAWALPPLRRGRIAVVAAGVVVGGVLAALLVHHLIWLLPSLLGVWAYLQVMALVVRRRGAGAFLAHAAVISALVASFGVLVDRNAFTLVHANQPGPFGTPLEPTPTLSTVTTDSGFQLSQTVDSDQCFAVLMCTPLLINKHLHMRGPSVSDGFSVRT
jgi:MFS family permease